MIDKQSLNYQLVITILLISYVILVAVGCSTSYDAEQLAPSETEMRVSVTASTLSIPTSTSMLPATLQQPTSTLTANPTVVFELAVRGIITNDEWTPYIKEFNGSPMALVPAGCFMMGNSDEQIDYLVTQCDELMGEGACDRSRWERTQQPQIQICSEKPFWIDTYEITNEEYAVFLNTTGTIALWNTVLYEIDPTPISGTINPLTESNGEWAPLEGYDNHPVRLATWYGAFGYCEWRDARLPMEHEWEYAARGPDDLIYPWGNAYNGLFLNSYGPNTDDGYEETSPVGSFPQGVSWVGALDMSGNVQEWVSSRPVALWDYFEREEFREDITDDGYLPGDPIERAVRGGSWQNVGYLANVAKRNFERANIGDGNTGFRCVRDYVPGEDG